MEVGFYEYRVAFIYFEVGELIKYIEEKIKEEEKERIEENGK